MHNMSTEENIKKYIMETRHMSLIEVTTLPLHKLLSLVEMKDMTKYNEFKVQLRKDGWII